MIFCLYVLLSFVTPFKNSSFKYGSIERKNIKTRFNLHNLVESHHLIPQQWKNHPILIKYGYDVSESYNIMFMPSLLGIKKLNTNRLVHTGGHASYNKYVKYNLDLIDTIEELDDLRRYLRYSMKGNPDNIPWK